MDPTKTLATGATLAFLGGAGIIIGTLLSFTEFARPWSFILGFIFGLMNGIVVALTLFGLNKKRKSSS